MTTRRVCPTCVELLERLSSISERLAQVSEHVFADASAPTQSSGLAAHDDCVRIRYLRVQSGQIRERLQQHLAHRHPASNAGQFA